MPESSAQRVQVQAIRTPGLGDTTYILSYAAAALVVDPQRDVDRFLQLLGAAELTVRFVLETPRNASRCAQRLRLRRA